MYTVKRIWWRGDRWITNRNRKEIAGWPYDERSRLIASGLIAGYLEDSAAGQDDNDNDDAHDTPEEDT